MSQYPQGQFGYQQSTPLDYQSNTTSRSIASFFNAVYAWMAVGLAVTAVIAYWVSTQQQFAMLLHGPARIVLILVEFGLVIAISAATQRISASAATGLFILFAAINGLMLSAIFPVYGIQAIGASFIVTAGMFAATSIFGYTTRTDLTRLGGILFMLLIGLILASVVNMFMASPGLYWIITYGGVVIFVGLTAYDTQKLKMMAVQTQDNAAMASRLSIIGSLILYLDFINLFIFMLRILGNRQR